MFPEFRNMDNKRHGLIYSRKTGLTFSVSSNFAVEPGGYEYKLRSHRVGTVQTLTQLCDSDKLLNLSVLRFPFN